ncbi:hypothetical protein IL306_013982 [Fusarium sp. DS 682]|nr:hypothetical protein IL306_013982 [Fusarium sp. DS 682]
MATTLQHFFTYQTSSLYFNDLSYHREDEEDDDFDMDEQYDFPCRTSSVKHLFIDGISDFTLEFYGSVASISENLQSVVLRVTSPFGPDLDDVDTFASHLARENAKSLQKLIIYNPYGVHGYRCTNYRPEELDKFENLRLFTMAASDIELGGLYQLGEHPNAEKLGEYVSEAFPSSTESIHIWGRLDEHVDHSKPNGITSDTLDSAIASLIESGVYENLKVIYLADVEKTHAEDDRGIPSEVPFKAGLKEPILQKSIAAGHKTGVHVRTLLNSDDGGYWKNFPARPDWFDLKTGPCGERPASWRLSL